MSSGRTQPPVISPASRSAVTSLDGLTAPEIQQQLERIQASQPFRSSRRCLVFLEFVVKSALNGRSELLKERTLGVEVFSRDPNYDTNQDPVVRGTASEVRKRLAQYYQMPGHEKEPRIELPAGSYLPEFHRPIETPAAVKVEPAPMVQPPMVQAPIVQVAKRRNWPWVVASGVVLVAVAGILASPHVLRRSSAVDEFWTPILRSSGPVLLCVGQPRVYNLLGNLRENVDKPFDEAGGRWGPEIANQKVTTTFGSILPNRDRYVALGDAMCLSDLAGLLSQKGRAYHVRGGGSTSFADLRENPTILIGGFTNDWTQRLMGQLRFSLVLTADRRSDYVFDRQNPAKRDWELTDVWPDWTMPMDYAVVSRVLDGTTGRVVVSAAGITQYGTAAAGEFLTNPEYFSEVLKNAPADWKRKNIQVVLATKVIGGTAGPPHVLATQYW